MDVDTALGDLRALTAQARDQEQSVGKEALNEAVTLSYQAITRLQKELSEFKASMNAKIGVHRTRMDRAVEELENLANGVQGEIPFTGWIEDPGDEAAAGEAAKGGIKQRRKLKSVK
jgi:hypothetical protein